ncbi:MAG: tetratricopeptide repeat protein [Planctomycetota bacterium]|jgi:tetratricopeptide (TPR) repeat protein
MDILKKDSYRKIIFAVFLVLASGLNVFAREKQPVQVLIDSYKLPDKLTTKTAEKTISELNQALTLCSDNALKFRIQYRIGILYFKSGDLSQALESFKETAQTPDCPDTIKLYSLNMAGQIYRMQAKDDKALKAFEEFIKLSQKFLTQDPNQENPASVLKLVVTAGFAKAEIYQYSQDYDSAIAEYKKIFACLKPGKTPDVNSYAPLALDRMSQFYLIKGQIEDYYQTAIELVEKYPDYYRTPIVRLETKAAIILKGKDTSVNFPRGSFDAPARLIALIKDSGDKELKARVIVLLKNLSSQYQQNYGSILLGYHYAWLLDASGEQQKADETLADICKQAASINPYMPGTASVISTLTNYAKLQQAVIFGEENRYREALEIVYSLKPDPNDVHMLNLTDSIKKALETLKREVPKDVNDQ